MRRLCLVACTVYLSLAGVALLRAASAAPPAPAQGIAVLASSLGTDVAPERLADFVQEAHFSPVVLDWAWITAHWEGTNADALARFLDLLAARNVPVAAMYRPRFLDQPTVPIQTDAAGKPAFGHGYYICFSSPAARQWGIAWGTKILRKFPQLNEIIIYNPLNQCQCDACVRAAKGNPYAHYDAVWKFLAEAKATWREQRPGVKLGVVFVNDPEFWKRGAGILDVAHPFLFVTADADLQKDAAEARACRDLLPGTAGSCLAKVTWGPNDKVSPARLAEFDRVATDAGLPYFLWTYDTLFSSSLYNPMDVMQALRLGQDRRVARAPQPVKAEQPAPAPAPAPATKETSTPAPQAGVGEFGNLTYSPAQIASISVEGFLQRMRPVEPGYQPFAAMNALIEKGKAAHGAARDAILSSVIAVVKDPTRPYEQRWQSCYVLGGIEDDRAVPTLLSTLQHDEALTGFAAETLAGFYLRNKRAAIHEALLQAAQANPAIREILERRLRELPDGSPAPAVSASQRRLQEVLNTPTEVLLWRMLYPDQDAQTDNFGAMNALLQKAKASDPEERKLILTLVSQAMQDPRHPESRRWQCCYVLSGSYDESVIPDLAKVLRTEKSELMRSIAAEALADCLRDFPRSAARDALLQAARTDRSPKVREVLTRRLGPSLPALEAAPAAPPATAEVPAGEYSPLQVQSLSAEALLQRLATKEEGYNDFAAMHALSQKMTDDQAAGRRQVLSLVVATMKDTRRSIYQRWQCCYVISGSGDERGVPDLIPMLRDPSATMRGVAAEALAQFPKNAAAHDALLQAAREETDPTVREVLTRRLGAETPAAAPAPVAAPAQAVKELAPNGPPVPPPGPARPVTKPLPWPFPGGQEDQNIFNNYQQATDIYIHCGLDFIHDAGTPVLAVDSGYVAVIATNYPQWITHHFFIVTRKPDDTEGWCYTHLDPRTFTFKQGDYVRQGQRLGSLVDFSVGNQPGVSHLHLHYVRFSRASGKLIVHSLLDPLYFFDWKDTEAPTFQPLRFVVDGTPQLFEADRAGLITVSGKVDILAAVADSAFPGQLTDYGVPVVMFSISDGRHTLQKLTVDHRGDVGDETRVKPLYLSPEQTKAFFEPYAFPRYHLLRVTKTDGDGRITAADASQCWDTTQVDARGRPLWPNGRYSVNVYAWDIAGNRAVVGAVVRVRNRWGE